MKNFSSWGKTIFWVIVIVGIFILGEYFSGDKEKNKEVNEIDWSGLMPSEEEIALRQYDLDLCKNKDEYEKYLKDEKYHVLDLYDYFDKQNHYNKNDKKTYYYIAAYDMIHSNELDTCIAAYKLETALPEPSQYISGYREITYSRHIVDSKDDRVLWERTADLSEGSDAYHDEFRGEVDKYRDNLPEWEALREKELEESEPYNSPILWKSDGDIFFPDINAITQKEFNKPYTGKFTYEEKLIVQNRINKEAGFGHPRYIIEDWNSKGGIRVIDAIQKKIQTVDISSIDLFTTEDYIYNDGESEKYLTYLEDYGAPETSGCYEYQNIENMIKCPDEMYVISGSKMCFDLNKKEEIDCRLIKF